MSLEVLMRILFQTFWTSLLEIKKTQSMIPLYRKQFNAEFNETKYQAYLNYINALYPNSVDFRIAETPLFLTAAFKAQLLEVGEYVCSQITRPDFISNTEKSLQNTKSTLNEMGLHRWNNRRA